MIEGHNVTLNNTLTYIYLLYVYNKLLVQDFIKTSNYYKNLIFKNYC